MNYAADLKSFLKRTIFFAEKLFSKKTNKMNEKFSITLRINKIIFFN